MNGASEKRNTEHSIIATWVYKSVLINGNNHGEIAIPTSRRNARIGRTHHSIVITKNMMIVRILGLLGHFLMFRTAMLFMMFSLVILNHLLYSNAEKKSH